MTDRPGDTIGEGERTFVEAEGLVHLTMGEFTLCGDAFDLASDEPGYEWQQTDKRTVTCDRCAVIVLTCRGVRTASSTMEGL